MTDTTPSERLRALVLGMLVLGSVFGATVTLSGSAAAGNQSPTVTIDSPDHNTNLTDPPTISGTASDDGTVETVKLRIQRSSDDKYFTGSGWQSSETWVSVGITKSSSVDWSYDTYDLQKSEDERIESDDTYDVTARVSDGSTTVTGERPKKINPADADAGAITYTVDTHDPQITSVTVTEKGGDDTVEDGDTVKVTADAMDGASGIDTVTVDASSLGGSASLPLTESSGTYTGTFTVSNPSVGDGATSLSVTATDYVGYTDTGSDTVTVETAISTVDSVTIERDFVGVVEDSDSSSVRVTGSGITDARGNTVDDGTATIEIAGQTYDATVSGGTFDRTIDPTKISDTASTGQTTVEVTNAENSATDSVVLVHEVISLSSGYNLVGTPMSAADVRFQDVSDVTTYDPTVTGGDSEWVSPNEEQIGEGYYAFAESDDARVGYVFEESGADKPEARYLHEGYNLVSAAPDLSTGDSVEVTDDLGAGVDPSSSDVQASVYTGVDLEDEATNGKDAFVDRSGSHKVSAYDGYIVEIRNGKVVRTITTDTAGYDPENS